MGQTVASPDPTRAPQPSLYARAAFFVITGSAAVFGALFAMSTVLVESSENRLLDERIGLARTTASFLEDRIRRDMHRLVVTARLLLDRERPASDPSGRLAFFAEEVGHGIYAEGALVLDDDGRLVAAAPEAMRLATDLPLEEHVAEARHSNDLVVSSLVGLGTNPVLLAVQPVVGRGGRRLGFVAALLQPAASDLLQVLHRSREFALADVRLVDSAGIVVASTDRRELFVLKDHEGTIARSISQRREFRGRCHQCHREDDSSPPRELEVLAFAPLPTLELGLIVLQKESQALAPAFALRRRLWLLGVALVALFVLFALLSVRAVVRPVAKLTRAVRQAELRSEPLAPQQFGRDEVGELATALELWRDRMLRSVETAQAHREALRVESEAIRRHLAALQDVSDASTASARMDVLVERTLERALELSGFARGALALEHRGHRFCAERELAPGEAEDLLAAAARAGADAGAAATDAPTFARFAPGEDGASGLKTAVAAVLRPAEGLSLTLAVVDDRAHEPVAPRWLASLLRHASMCASHLLLREADRERQQQQELFLHRVLQAQEDERSRVARDLHDTVAQDLAALRLDLERLASRADDPDARRHLEAAGAHAREMHETVRRILLDLRLSILESAGLVPALRWLVERAERDHGLRGHFLVDGNDSQELGYEASVALFRILQETLLNVVHHACAEHVFVLLRVGADEVGLTVEDDGVGFEPAAVRTPSAGGRAHGLGLVGMEERARLLGGRLHVSSTPGEGTTVVAVIPLRARRAIEVPGGLTCQA